MALHFFPCLLIEGKNWDVFKVTYLLNVDVIYAEESYPRFDHGILFQMPELLKVVYQESDKVNKEQKGTSCLLVSG